jgi:hypothetical protein
MPIPIGCKAVEPVERALVAESTAKFTTWMNLSFESIVTPFAAAKASMQGGKAIFPESSQSINALGPGQPRSQCINVHWLGHVGIKSAGTGLAAVRILSPTG